MPNTDVRPVDVRAESVVYEAELRAEGIDLRACSCGTAMLEVVSWVPGSRPVLVCAGCGADRRRR